MGEVWRARHGEQRSPVAVKVLTASGSSRPMYVASFLNEVRAAAGLDHPHVAMVLDTGIVPESAAAASDGALVAGTPYLAMELVEGETLAEHLGTLPWSEIVRLLTGLLDALAHAHARGIVHRDLKLSNVLYDPAEGTFKLTDFGIAHATAATGDPFRWGTPAYMPPEQVLGRWWEYGPWTDLYSLGCCAWALISGERPFPDDAVVAGPQRVLPPLRARFSLPAGFDLWLRQLTDPEPARRYQQAADAAWALHGLCRGFVSADLRGEWLRESGPDETPTLSFQAVVDLADTLVPRAPDPTTLPPVPSDWRRPKAPATSARLTSAGLGLYGLRRVPMVAREAERDLLWRALAEARDAREPRLVLVRGAAGVGKSRLGEWWCERVHEVGAATVLRAGHGPIPERRDGLPGLLATFLRTGGLSVAQIRQRVVAAWGEAPDPGEVHGLVELLLPEPGSSGVQGPAERHAVVRRFVARLARRRPVVLCLDDVHGSLDSVEFVRALLRPADALPVVVVLMVRDDLLAGAPLVRAVLDDLAGRPDARTLRLGPLSEADHRALVEELLGLDGAVARLVEQRTAGNPMFAVQLVGDWVSRGILVPGPRGFELREGAELALPDDLHAVWRTRLDELLRERSPDDRVALELAALLGHHVDPVEWRAACGHCGIAPVPELVEALLTACLAVADEGGSAGAWRFAHAMLRESLERGAEEAGRAPALHRACAAAVVGGGPSSRERLARHLLGSGAAASALDPLVDAIEGHCATGEFDRADGLLETWERAVAQVAPPDGDPRWVRGLRAAAAVHRYKDRPEELLRSCRQLEDGVRDHGWPEQLLVYVRMQQGRLARRAGDFPAAIRLFREALDRSADGPTRASLHARIGNVLAELGELAAAETELRAGVELARAHGDEHGAGDAWLGAAGVALHRGELAEAERRTAGARAHYLAARHRWGLASCEELAGEIARHRGDFAAAIAHYRQSAASFRSLGTESAALVSEFDLVVLELQRGGRAARLVDELERCALRAEGFGLRTLWATARLAQLVGDAAAGDEERFDRHLAEAAGVLADTGFVSPDVAWSCERAAREARSRGWSARADDLFGLARAQWAKLSRRSDVARVEREAGGGE